MGRRLPPWRQSREPSLSATVGPETVLASPVIAFIVTHMWPDESFESEAIARPADGW
jgi:hypothetical protein